MKLATESQLSGKMKNFSFFGNVFIKEGFHYGYRFSSATVIDTSDDIGTVTDILARRIEAFELRAQLGSPPHWMALFDEDSPRSPHNHQHLPPHSPSPRLHSRQPRSPRCHRTPGLLSSNASLTSDSDSPASVSPVSARHGPLTPHPPRVASAPVPSPWTPSSPLCAVGATVAIGATASRPPPAPCLLAPLRLHCPAPVPLPAAAPAREATVKSQTWASLDRPAHAAA